MPELPDVEIYRKYFNRTGLNKKIDKVEVIDKSILFNTSIQKLSANLVGKKIISASRHGKYFFGKIENNKYLMIHFGMTGRFDYKKKGKIPDYSKVILYFSDSFLSYVCIRKLGKVAILESKNTFIEDKNLGPDALDLDWGKFKKLTKNKRGKIKGALMDQKFIAGLGNIYNDEIFFQSNIDPQRKISSLNQSELKKIYENIKYVTDMAINKKADPDKLPESWLLTNREEGKKCPKCSGEIKKITVSGRGTYYCPSCQK